MQIFTPLIHTYKEIPIASYNIQAGFPSPAEDYVDKKIDLNSHLIKHPNATFFVKAIGDSMINIGIYPGDLLIVDKSVQVRNGHIVIAYLNSEFTVKEFKQENGKTILKSANINYPDIFVENLDDFEVWGVVTSVIHNFV